MELKKVIASVRTQVLGEVEERLTNLRVKEISVTRVKGYGEFATFIHPEWRFTPCADRDLCGAVVGGPDCGSDPVIRTQRHCR